jgi:predicted HicB family RNase H-like nuclease
MKKVAVKKIAARYPKFVEWSEEDNCFIGRCPQLFRGGVHGADEAKVYRELCQVAEEWVQILEEDGAVLPKPKRSADYSGKFVVRVEPELHQRLALKAMAHGQSLNSFIQGLLTKG